MSGPCCTHSRFFLPALVAGALAPCAVGQDVLYEIKGTSAVNPIEFGVVVGDWNGDAIPDVALMSRYDDTVAPDAGAVEIRSGKDGSVLHTFHGDFAAMVSQR